MRLSRKLYYQFFVLFTVLTVVALGVFLVTVALWASIKAEVSMALQAMSYLEAEFGVTPDDLKGAITGAVTVFLAALPVTGALWEKLVEKTPSSNARLPDSPSLEPSPPESLRLRVLANPASLQRAVDHTLDADFKEKYTPDLYVPRRMQDEAFAEFLRQSEYTCFVVTGATGKGKSNFLCHQAKKLNGRLPDSPNTYAVLVPASALELAPPDTKSGWRRRRTPSLEEQILARVAGGHPVRRRWSGDLLRKELPSSGDFFAWCKLLNRHDREVVVFIDAINELRGSDAPALFNAAFDSLVARVRRERLPVRFCLSCRSEFWQKFAAPPAPEWIRKHHRTSPRVDDLTEGEAAAALAKYEDHYKVTIEFAGEARRKSVDPLMLRLLYSAVQAAGHKTLLVTSLRRKSVLDQYATEKRTAIAKAIRGTYRAKPDTSRAPHDIESSLTPYLIRLAGLMLQQGRPDVSLWDAQDVARGLSLPDGRYSSDPGMLLHAPDAVFGHFVREAILAERKNHRYGFVFETYFEYSLGRFLALEDWYADRDRPEEIRARLGELLKHNRTLVGKHNFTNLPGAIQFAVLTIDTDPTYEEERVLLLPEILRTIMQAEGLHWTRFALKTIQETRLASPAGWRELESDSEAHDRGRRLFESLLNILDEVVSHPGTDFVVMWDTAECLKKLASAQPRLVLAHVRDWMGTDRASPGDRLKPFFALNALSKIARADLTEDNRRELVRHITELGKEPRVISDFWLVQALVSAAVDLTEVSRRSGVRLPEALHCDLRAAVEHLACEGQGAVRAHALGALPALSEGHANHMERVLTHLERVEDRWAWWNVAHNLHAWPDTWAGEIRLPLRILERATAHPSDDVKNAAWRAVQINGLYERHYPEAVTRIRQGQRDSRWGESVTPGGMDNRRHHLTGVVYHPLFLEPAYGHHIECRERIQAILSRIESRCQDQISWVVPREATPEQIKWVHGEAPYRETYDRHGDGSDWPTYLQDLEKMERGKEVELVADTLELRPESLKVARYSVGAVLEGIDHVMKGDAPAAWALNRPPGHLANNNICIFNNVAIGAHYAAREWRKRRILIVDCDAHHGKHTDHVFTADPDVLYFSIHVDQDYTREEGTVSYIGKGRGEGYTFNLLHPPGMDDEGYSYIVDNLLVPVAKEFKPELILLSAGFDGLATDYLTPQCVLTERAYIHLARRLGEVARDLEIKLVATLEGGYSLDGNARSLVHMMNAFGDWGIPEDEIGFSDRTAIQGQVRDTRESVRDLVRRRVRLMEEVRARNSEYAFNTRAPHWQRILEPEQSVST